MSRASDQRAVQNLRISWHLNFPGLKLNRRSLIPSCSSFSLRTIPHLTVFEFACTFLHSSMEDAKDLSRDHAQHNIAHKEPVGFFDPRIRAVKRRVCYQWAKTGIPYRILNNGMNEKIADYPVLQSCSYVSSFSASCPFFGHLSSASHRKWAI